MNEQQVDVYLDLLTTCEITKKTFSGICKKNDLNFIQLLIIVLSGCRNMNVSSLAEKIGVSRSAISQALVKLFLKKYIRKKQDAENKKIFYIALSKKGNAIKEETINLMNLKIDVLKEQMGNDNFNLLRSLLQKVNEIISKNLGKEGITC